ncbi:hypothetical protein C8T65DRAFT_700259 [Cerioporus squamosus]|nr:hypothetical protein C8T65DRAFT_700259 [Cerioporus squamosus]
MFISRVVDIQHLKGKWRPFEARHMLLKENGLFLADERVVQLLPDLKGKLKHVISSTYFYQNQGTCSSMKIGPLAHSPSLQKPMQVLANLETALPKVVKQINGGWDNIQSLLIKTNSSVALPIWQCDLGTQSGGWWEGLVASPTMAGDKDMKDGELDEGEKMEVEPQQ